MSLYDCSNLKHEINENFWEANHSCWSCKRRGCGLHSMPSWNCKSKSKTNSMHPMSSWYLQVPITSIPITITATITHHFTVTPPCHSSLSLHHIIAITVTIITTVIIAFTHCHHHYHHIAISIVITIAVTKANCLYSNTSAATVCLPCPAGTYSNSYNTTSCLPCGHSTTSEPGSTSCDITCTFSPFWDNSTVYDLSYLTR